MTEQTEREAFEAWWKREDTAGLSEACRMSAWNGWLAACAWQRERDAEVCEASGYADAAADAIRAQGKQ